VKSKGEYLLDDDATSAPGILSGTKKFNDSSCPKQGPAFQSQQCSQDFLIHFDNYLSCPSTATKNQCFMCEKKTNKVLIKAI
jgi:hypothetical protein